MQDKKETAYPNGIGSVQMDSIKDLDFSELLEAEKRGELTDIGVGCVIITGGIDARLITGE